MIIHNIGLTVKSFLPIILKKYHFFLDKRKIINYIGDSMTKNHYVDNKKFYSALVEYKKSCNKAEKKWLKSYEDKKKELLSKGLSEKQAMKELPDIDYPPIPEFIGLQLYLIAENLAKKPNFSGYSYKDDMIADGYEDCVLRIKTFDPEKSNNPFAYFTQACYFAAIRRIKKEQKQQDIKLSILKNSNIISELESNVQDSDDANYSNSYIEFLKENLEHVETDAEKENRKKNVVKKTTLAYQKSLLDKDVNLDTTKEYFENIEKEEYDE